MGMVLIAMGFGPGGILANDSCHRCGLGHKDMKSEIVVD